MSVRPAVLGLALLAAAAGRAVAQEVAAPAVASPAPTGVPPRASYEGEALARALALRHLEIDPAPAGKRVGKVHVVNLDVFGDDEAFLRWANWFHVTTREFVIEREVLVGPGDPWDEARVDETRRRLREPLFTTLVVVVPVRSREPGHVDVLVVTRDIWSLRMNSRFEVQEGVLSDLSLSLSENNLFGLRKQVALVFDLDLGAYAIGPQYVDPNIGGTHLQLVTKLGAIFSRATGEFEGTRSTTSLALPLWSLDREWGAAVAVRHYDATVREFFGADLLRYDDPDTAEVEAVPVTYGLRSFGLETSGVRQLGGAIKHRVTVGHQLAAVRPRTPDELDATPTLAEHFARDLMPRSERVSALFVRYTLFTPRFVVYRDVDSYDLAEDGRLGPELSTELGVAREEIGSEGNFVSGSIGAAWTVDLLGDGFARASFGVAGRREDGALIDRFGSATITLAAPRVAGVRLVARGNISAKVDSVNNQPFKVGGLTGLRGYPIDVFRGDRQVVTNLELRSPPLRLLFTRVGVLAFWDMGHAADRLPRLDLHHDVGVGGRMLIPQLQPYVFRLDWAIASEGPGAGLPGRITAGVQQVF